MAGPSGRGVERTGSAMGFFKPAEDRGGSEEDLGAEDEAAVAEGDDDGSLASSSEGEAGDGLGDLGVDVDGGAGGDALL